MANRKYEELAEQATHIAKRDGADAGFAYLDGCIEENPEFIEAYLARGMIHTEIECYDFALHDFENAIKINPNEPESYFLRGNLYVKSGDINKALGEFCKTIELDANHSMAYTNRANVYLKMNELQKVVNDCTKAIELSPNSFEAYYNRGLAYLNMRQLEKAVEDLNKAIELEPACADAYFKRGAYYSQYTSDVQEAISDLEKFLELAPNHEYANLARNEVKKLKGGKTGKSGGCYVATCVYGSYDCPEVWTLRRYRDDKLSKFWFGRLFIRIYYTVSPNVVALFGNQKWFNKLCKPIIDKLVVTLQNNGVENTPYCDGRS
ncbi:MAG: tetratricopeptide repeat protein [Chitinispirillales bacterium]|jgi:tetratricopeptide (TPR) repeat protein|nr:tetratricopeptide repeat protein [Chitinispirillales bacterium]